MQPVHSNKMGEGSYSFPSVFLKSLFATESLLEACLWIIAWDIEEIFGLLVHNLVGGLDESFSKFNFSMETQPKVE